MTTPTITAPTITNPVNLLYASDGSVAAPRIVICCAQKGGVGKSSITAGVSESLLSEHGRHVVVLDGDYQGGTTRLMGARAAKNPLTEPPVPVHGMLLFAAGTSLRQATRAQVVAHIERAAAAAAGGVLVADTRPDMLDDWHDVLLGLPNAFALLVPEVAPASIPEVRKLAALVEARGREYLIVGNKDTRRSTSKRARAFLQSGFPQQISNVWIPTAKQADMAFELGRPVTAVDPDAPIAMAIRAITGQLVSRGVA